MKIINIPEQLNCLIIIIPFFRVRLIREVKKWEDRKDFNFSLFCLVGSEKVQRWKK